MISRHRERRARLVTSVVSAVLVAGCAPAVAWKFEDSTGWKLEDDFSSRAGGWPTRAAGGDEWGYVDGKYRIRITVAAGQGSAGRIAGIPLVRQGKRLPALTIEADAVQKSGPPGTLHGVSCGTSPAELYFFLMNVDGDYFIVRDDARMASPDLLGSGRANVRLRGIGEVNRIRAQCVGGEQEAVFTLSVNGEKVAEARGQRGKSFDRAAFVVTTSHAIAGRTGTAVPGGSPIGFEAEVLFDNFVARAP